MAMEAVIAGVVLGTLGTLFALFLGISSARIEHQREHEAGHGASH
ncbi:MAG: hypothetical protein AMXMBFR23_22470 [Chloroflexota bacterium]